MRRYWRPILIALAVFAVAVSLINASWIAPRPEGRLVLVAHRGLAQQFSREGVDNDTCTATRIRPPGENLYIENTLPSIYKAVRMGAGAVELDVQPTADGQMVAFHDWTLDCRTDGQGPVRKRSLAELKALDAGYGYTADGGRTYPLRGRGIGAIPTVEEVLREVPSARLVFNFKSRDPGDADTLVAAFGRAGVKIDGRYSFYGHPRVTRRLKALVPGAWTWFKDELKGCLADYVKLGWTGYVPKSCRDTTVAIPLNYQWAIWGWPNRFQARMKSAGTRVIMLGDYTGGSVTGIERPEQLDDVPRDFKGYLWIEDFHTVGRALRR